MITGLLILLTLTNIEETRTNIEIINIQGIIGILFNFVVVTAILPFALSAYGEINREIKIKYVALMPKLTKELEIATEKDDAKKINELKTEIKHLERVKPKKIETDLQFMRADEASRINLFRMKLGFIYVVAALMVVMIISQIQFIYEFGPDTTLTSEECKEIIKKIDELNQVIKNTPSEASYYDELVPVAKNLLLEYEIDLSYDCERLE